MHVLQALVFNLDSECEGLGLGIDVSRTHLLELNLGLELLDGLLDHRVLLVHDIDYELRCVKSEGIRSRVISTKLR